MNKIISTVIGIVLLILLIFSAWFGMGLLSGGDWHFLFGQSLLPWKPGIWAWDSTFGNGFGSNDVFLLPLNSYFLSASRFLLFFLSWNIAERIIFFWPYLILSLVSSYYFARTFQEESAVVYILTFLLFSANTYALMLVGGGQMGVALAYSLSLLVFAFFVRVMMQKEKTLLSSTVFLAGVIFALQIALDTRIVYVTVTAVVVFFLFFIKTMLHRNVIARLTVVFVIAMLLNAFWLLPLAVVHQNPLQQMGAIYVTKGAVEFFSFAKFENTIGLLHPNWPENIFGFTHFMKPEFLLLPILAFGSLLFVRNIGEKKKQKSILFFAFIGLVGAFLAKGANEPFGGIYLWMFDHVPGFFMFRDPTKWYVLIVLSYTALITFTIDEIYQFLKRKNV